jgi:hypothetical protein
MCRVGAITAGDAHLPGISDHRLGQLRHARPCAGLRRPVVAHEVHRHAVEHHAPTFNPDFPKPEPPWEDLIDGLTGAAKSDGVPVEVWRPLRPPLRVGPALCESDGPFAVVSDDNLGGRDRLRKLRQARIGPRGGVYAQALAGCAGA